ncbi:cytochrome P450 [Pyxidicoccus sp. 3LG]
MSIAVEFEPLHPETLRDPYPVYARMRALAPVMWQERLNSWLLTRHAECLQVLKDSRRFAADWRRVGVAVPEHGLSVQSMDPPEHGELRGLLVSAYRAQDLAAVERRAYLHANRLLAGLRAEGGGELMTRFAAPLALHAVCDFLGVPAPDPASFGEMSDAIIRGMDAGLAPERAAPGAAAGAGLSALVASWFEPPPAGGMLGFLARSESAAGMPRGVLMNSMRVVFHAGYTSVYSAVGSSLISLLRHGVELSRLGDPALLETAVEELFRYDGPVQATGRVCTEDVELGGVRIARGQELVLLLGSANRDPEAFSQPEALVLDRQPNPHLAFGWGIHACVGGLLAKAVVRLALSSLIEHAPRLRLSGDVVHKPQATQRCPDRIPVTFGT